MTRPSPSPPTRARRRPGPDAHAGRRRGRPPREDGGRHVEHRTGDRRLAWWMSGLILVVAIGVTVVLRSSFFAVQTVQIDGEARTTPGAVHDALAIDPDQALATFDVDAAEARIAALPWVDQVQVSRGWPSTLRVRIREHGPAAAVGPENGARWLVVSRDGHVLEQRLTPPVGLPVLVVPRSVVDGADIGELVTPVLDGLTLALELPLQLDPWVESWVVDADGVISAELRGSATAVFGDRIDPRSQFVSLASILGGEVSRTCIRTIDLTIGDTPVVHRDDDCLLVARTL